MTVFADALDLRTAVVEQVANPNIVDVFPRLVGLAEAYLNRNLRTASQIKTATVTFASGVAPLPADFAEAIGLFDAAGCEYIQQSVQYTRPIYGARRYYSINAAGLFLNGYDGDMSLEYYATIPTIAGAMTDTNWLLAKYPSAYLSTVSLEAAKFMRDAEMAKAMAALVQEAMGEVASDDFNARYSRARVRIAGVTP